MPRKKHSEIEMKIMRDVSRNLKSILFNKDISQKELSEMTGLATSTISDYVNGKTLISPGNLQLIADTLNVKKSEVDPSIVIDIASYPENEELISLPIVGAISCGNGVLAYEEIEGYETTPKSWLNGGEYFYLRAKGDSMINARINDGDLLLIRKQSDVEHGQIAAVLIENEALLKRVIKTDGIIFLQSENPLYPIRRLDENKENRIIGKLKKVVISY